MIDSLKNDLMQELYGNLDSKGSSSQYERRDDYLLWMEKDEHDRFAYGKEFDLSNLPGTEKFRLADIEVNKSDEDDSQSSKDTSSPEAA